MKIPKSSSQNHHAELTHPYTKLVRLNKGIVNDMTTFKQTRKRLNELQLKINEKHRKIRHGEEELEINEELRQLYAEFFENSKREQDLIIAILANLSQLVEKAEERQKEETNNSLAQQQLQTEPQVQTATPTVTSSEPSVPTTSAVSSPISSSSVPVKDPMQVDEEEETISSQASSSNAQNTSDSEKQTTKARTAAGSKGGRNKKGGKSVKEPASSSERKVETSQPITSDKYLQIEEGIPVKSKVAARISGATEESGDSGFWILASILKYYPDKNRYDVIDEDNSDDEESTSTDRKTYKLNKNHIVQLPTDMSQHKLFKKGDKVFAVFPDTTTFYPAIVDSVPTKTSKNYSLKFEDDEEDGKTPTRKVNFKYVMSVPK